MNISATAIKTVSDSRPNLSLSNFADDLCVIGELLLDAVDYKDKEAFAMIEENQVIASDNSFMFTVEGVHCSSTGDTDNSLSITTADGTTHYITTVI